MTTIILSLSLDNFCTLPEHASIRKYCLAVKIATLTNSQSFMCHFLDLNCGGVFEEGNGVISSPGYPNGYANNLDCVWLLYRSVEYPDFIFTDFETESNYDLVKITAGR